MVISNPDRLRVLDKSLSMSANSVSYLEAGVGDLSSTFCPNLDLADLQLSEFSSPLPLGDVMSDSGKLFRQDTCTSGVGGITVGLSNDNSQQMYGLAGLGGDSTMDALDATLSSVAAEKSLSALRHCAIEDQFAHSLMFSSQFTSVESALKQEEKNRPKRRNVRISKDPQSVAARHRRERISDRIRVLQRLVPGGTKMDTASMLDEAISYVKFLKTQVKTLETVTTANEALVSQQAFGATSLCSNAFASIPYGGMGMGSSPMSQPMPQYHHDFKDAAMNPFASFADSSCPGQPLVQSARF